MKTTTAIWATAIVPLLFAGQSFAQPDESKSPPPEVPEEKKAPAPENDAPLRDRKPITTEKLRPWAEGVPTDKQEKALALFQEGNKLLRESLFLKAAGLYREALDNWDHPAIHYNLALSLITLDQPVSVFKSLEKAMAFGAEPLEAENYQRAINYKTLVSQLVAKVEIVCDVPGAQVSLDGTQLFVGPGRWSDLVRIGEHSVVARRSGYLPTNETRRFAPAEDVKIDLKLFTLADVTVYRRKWAAWKPFAVLGGGAAVAAIGGIVHLSAANSMTEFNDGVRACGGCVPDSNLAAKRDSARSKETVAYVSYAIGIAGIAAGAVLTYINREKAYRDESAVSGIAVVPSLSPDLAGVSAVFTF